MLVFAESAAATISVESRALVPAALRTRVAEMFGLPESELSEHQEVFEEWAEELAPYLEWQDPLGTCCFHLRAAIGAGRAQVNALRALEETLSPEARERMRNSRLLVMLRLTPND